MAVTGETRDVAGLDGALDAIAARTAEVTGADVVVVRLVDESGAAGARAVHAESAALRAELEGSRVAARSVPACLAIAMAASCQTPGGSASAAVSAAAALPLRTSMIASW